MWVMEWHWKRVVDNKLWILLPLSLTLNFINQSTYQSTYLSGISTHLVLLCAAVFCCAVFCCSILQSTSKTLLMGLFIHSFILCNLFYIYFCVSKVLTISIISQFYISASPFASLHLHLQLTEVQRLRALAEKTQDTQKWVHFF